MKKSVPMATISFTSYDPVLLPLDLAQQIQLIIAKHGIGVKRRYCSKDSSYIRLMVTPRVPDVAIEIKASREVDGTMLSDREVEEYMSKVFTPFADADDGSGALMTPLVWQRLTQTNGGDQ